MQRLEDLIDGHFRVTAPPEPCLNERVVPLLRELT